MRGSRWKQQNESQEMAIRMFPGTPVSIPLYVLLDLRLLSVYEKRQASQKKLIVVLPKINQHYLIVNYFRPPTSTNF